MKDKKKHIKWEDRAPTLEIRGKNYFSELSKWEVGEEYELVLKVRLTRKEESTGDNYGLVGCCGCDDEDCGDDHEENRRKQSAGFEVVDIKSNGKISKDDSAEGNTASKYNKLRKQGKSVADARRLSGM